MSVKKEPSGRRSVELELEVPGSPEQVWQAMATGPGITAWFTPTDVEEREGGAIDFHLGPGMDSHGIVTGWEPPTRFAYEERDWAPNAPPLATEITVEARSGATCVVRMVHSLFTSSDEWDDQLEGFEAGWPWCFSVLQLYLGSFAGQPSRTIHVTRPARGSSAEAWDALRRALGISEVGQRVVPQPGVPTLDGVVSRLRADAQPAALMSLDRPSPGAALIGVYTWADSVTISIALYLYGDHADSIATVEEPAWRRWIDAAPFAAPPAGAPS